MLFGGRWQPVTKCLTFIEGSVDDVVGAFLGWQKTYIEEPTGRPLTTRVVRGDLEELLEQLQPLTSPVTRRWVFIPTAPGTPAGGPWVCVLPNSHNGADNGVSAPWVARGFNAIRIESSASSLDHGTNRGTWGLHRFGVFEPDHDAPAANGLVGVKGRTVGVAQFESLRRWDWVDMGEPLPFEDTHRYAAKRVRDRSTQEMLLQYAAACGLSPFEPGFYAPNKTAVLVERTDPLPYNHAEFSLAEVRAGLTEEDFLRQRKPAQRG